MIDEEEIIHKLIKSPQKEISFDDLKVILKTANIPPPESLYDFPYKFKMGRPTRTFWEIYGRYKTKLRAMGIIVTKPDKNWIVIFDYANAFKNYEKCRR